MSKAAIGLGILGLGATTAVAAPLAMTFGGGSSGEGEVGELVRNESETPAKPGTFKKPNWKGTLPTLTSSKDIKNDYQSVDCINEYFKGNIDWNKTNSDKSALSESFNFNPSQTKGCLIVDYYEQKYGDKWWGEFKLSWSLTDGEQHGFVTVVQAKTQNSKLLVDSAIYVFGSATGQGREVKYNAEKTEEVNEDSKLSSLIPQPGSLITESEYQNKQNWDFNSKPSNACNDTSCVGEAGETKKTSAVWKITYESGGEAIDKLFSNINDWFRNGFDLEDKVSHLQNGGVNIKLSYEAKTVTEGADS